MMQLRHCIEEVGDKACTTGIAHGFCREVRCCNASRGTLSADEQISGGGD